MRKKARGAGGDPSVLFSEILPTRSSKGRVFFVVTRWILSRMCLFTEPICVNAQMGG